MYLSEELEELPVSDQEKLANVILGHGNLKKAIKMTGLAGFTIKRAAMGFRVNPDTMKRLLKYLKNIEG